MALVWDASQTYNKSKKEEDIYSRVTVVCFFLKLL